MRFALATALLLGGLAACSQTPSENAPAATPAATQPTPSAPPMAGPFDGHYVGTGTSSAAASVCKHEQNYDFTVANNEITGTESISVAPGVKHGHGRSVASNITGHVAADGSATLQLAPQGAVGARGTVTGKFVTGQFTGHSGRPCEREITASRQ